MSIADDDMPDEGGDDLLAAEYVLGVLAADERAAAARRIDTEPAFARLVERWEEHLAPMGAAYAPAVPMPAVKAAIDRRLFAVLPASEAPAPSPLWSSLALWRGLAATALAALVLAIVVPLLTPPPPQARYVASLASGDSDVRYVAIYDPSTHDVRLRHLSGERESGRDFELWMIEGDNPPVSMGIIPVGSAVDLPVDTAAGDRLQAGTTLAISLEPTGGSPTGLPTGPVISVGDLFRL